MDIKRIALVAAIAVFFAVLVVAGMDLFLTRPNYSDFCKVPQFTPAAIEKLPSNGASVCPNVTQPSPVFYQGCSDKEGQVNSNYSVDGCVTGYYCDMCGKLYNDADKVYKLYAFAISVVFGTAAIVFGVMAPDVIESIASGLLYGGLLLLVYGTFAYADLSNKYFRFFAIGFDLAIIIWATWRKVEQARKNPENMLNPAKRKKKRGERPPG